MYRALRHSALLLCLASPATFAQPGGNPFHSHNDKGETVHILPGPAALHNPNDTQPTFAPSDALSVAGASYGSGLLLDHGGLEIANAGFQAIFYTSALASTKGSLNYNNLSTQITAFIKAFPDNAKYDGGTNDDYTIIQQYGSHASIAPTLAVNPANVASVGNPYIDKKTAVASFTDAQVQSYLSGLLTSGVLAPKSNVIYGIYFPSGMTICTSNSSCSGTSFCAYHGHFTYGSTQIKYAAFPYPGSGCSISGLAAADILTVIGSHEIREAVTDPGDFGAYAWYDANGYEGDDKCAWHNLYQMVNGKFWVQPTYSNGGTRTASGFTATYPGPGCIVPR
jgi:hypothetical protein